ncbi:MAG: hypothetical protein ABI658_11715 [Acidimicrobiales bacterium]
MGERVDAWFTSFGRAAIDVGLNGVTFLDAASLRVLLAAVRRNPNPRVVRVSPVVQRVLDLTGTTGALVGTANRGSVRRLFTSG